ncbi:hypothetical protein [Halobaculum magnesiiphilum]|uniref:Uncharacterized protein n=1 Tax=Halobaculum magnesiiphilum TaxID=1017351 RepID=A0A8T8WB32_9EURY|nr:hypothetical protein [Halobaculum magnesiiphilum]QZP37059.1 hypothetical protein K6T50_12270 [Halobaculum magnesiiphilum]
MSLARQELKRLEHGAYIGSIATLALLTLWIAVSGLISMPGIQNLIGALAATAAFFVLAIRGYIYYVARSGS